MNAQVIRIQASAWRPRKGGSVKLVIEVRPETQAEWVDALEVFKQRPELSVTVVAPKLGEITHGGITHPVALDSPLGVTTSTDGPLVYRQGYDAAGMPKADVDCPEPECFRGLGHDGEHNIPPRCPELGCQLAVGHLGAHAILIRPCPEPKCDLSFGHSGEHHLFPNDCPEPNCILALGHPGGHDGRRGAYDNPGCHEPRCQLDMGHTGPHDSPLGGPFLTPDCPKPDCNLLAEHKGKCVKKKVAK